MRENGAYTEDVFLSNARLKVEGICAIYPVKTETGLKMEINTKVSKAVLYCSLTPYHFTLKPAVKAALSTVPIKACGKDWTSSQNNRRLNAFTLALRAVPDCSTSPAASRRDANTVSCVFPLVSPSCLYTPVSFLSLRFHLTGEEWSVFLHPVGIVICFSWTGPTPLTRSFNSVDFVDRKKNAVLFANGKALSSLAMWVKRS